MLAVLPLDHAERLPTTAARLAEVDPDVALAEQMIAAARAAGVDQPEPVADFLIDELDAESLLDRRPRPMSRGELQQCALLITLSAPVPALALVDPTAGLDLPRRRAVVALLRDLASDHQVAVASDDPLFGDDRV
ncbi:MAG: hypothetical protein AAF081_03285 [Actinomycetota bacterium]